MKDSLPDGHGLSDAVIEGLIFRSEGKVSLSDVQYGALDAGVGRGESVLVVSPTSTGKTQIGLWAIAQGLTFGNNTVYLVTHRALAKQKFEDFKDILLDRYLGGDKSSIVIATGDYVEDASGQYPAAPLSAPLLVATYEKYLALLSASGVPNSMQNTVVVCDEIQLIGDENRGQNVEVLLTLMRNAGWRQFVGLSAVLLQKDAEELANWLNVKLLKESRREKHLRYECWSGGKILSVSSSEPDNIDWNGTIPHGIACNTISILSHVLKQKNPPLPIIVFCMKKKDTYDLAEEFIKSFYPGKKGQLSLEFEALPETSANTLLARTLEFRVASHNADLTDDERSIVERYLLAGKLDVVFATSTLAAGVNFPLGAAIFADWQRWDSAQRQPVPIEAAEFHNMAGRVGRMGFEHSEGRVIYFSSGASQAVAAKYLAIGDLPKIKSRVTPERFNQLALQLLASGLCSTRGELEALICKTFSALREEDRNTVSYAKWPQKVSDAVDNLIGAGFAIQNGAGVLSVTPVGKAVGFSGLLPETGVFLVDYLSKESVYLSSLLNSLGHGDNKERLEMLLFSACLSSPEFRPQAGVKQTRYLPYPIQNQILYNADQISDHLTERVWQVDPMPISASWLCEKWITGVDIRSLERELNALSAGMLNDMFRNLSWILQGLAAIAMAAGDKRVHVSLRPASLNVPDNVLGAISKLTRILRRLAFRVQEGLSDDVLWMAGLCPPGAEYRLGRHEILALKKNGITTPQQLMLGDAVADAARNAAFAKAKPSPQAKSNWVRDICRSWKTDQRKQAAERHKKRASKCQGANLVEDYYSAKGDAFEVAFENVLVQLGISFKRLDDKTKTGAPDYLLEFKGSSPIIVELKSKEGDKLVDYNKAVEVLAASEIHGYKDAFCVTLCHPGVDPSVPQAIIPCGRLCVVESGDLGEALLRICESALSEQQAWQWLCTPGQAVAEDLPYRTESPLI